MNNLVIRYILDQCMQLSAYNFGYRGMCIPSNRAIIKIEKSDHRLNLEAIKHEFLRSSKQRPYA